MHVRPSNQQHRYQVHPIAPGHQVQRERHELNRTIDGDRFEASEDWRKTVDDGVPADPVIEWALAIMGLAVGGVLIGWAVVLFL